MWKGIGIWAVLWRSAGARPHRRRTLRSTAGWSRGRHLRHRRVGGALAARGLRQRFLSDAVGAIKGAAASPPPGRALPAETGRLAPDRGQASARAFSKKLAEVPIFTSAWTSINGAINYALPLFEGNGFSACARSSISRATGPTTRARRCPPPAIAPSPPG